MYKYGLLNYMLEPLLEMGLIENQLLMKCNSTRYTAKERVLYKVCSRIKNM